MIGAGPLFAGPTPSYKNGDKMADEYDETKPDMTGWLACPEPPAEARMVNTIKLNSGHSLKELVDVDAFPPLVNEDLYRQIMAMYPGDGVLFTDGTGGGAEMTREAWQKLYGADPLVQIAWQRRDTGGEVAKLSGKGAAGRLKVKF